MKSISMAAWKMASTGCLLGLIGLFAPAFSAGAKPSGQKRPPNFVVIMADDLGAKELGCYGHPEHKTPNLDRLARQGMRFRTCFSTPICSPTRVMIMTGRYGFRTGWYNLIGRAGSPTRTNPKYSLAHAEITFAQVLKPKGYATALAGKWQLTGKVPGLIHECGFDEYRIWAYTHNLPPGVVHTGGWEIPQKKPARYWHPCILQSGKYLPSKPHDYGPDLFADFIIDFIRRHKAKPFLVYYPMCLTHKPWAPTPDLQQPGKKTAGGLQNNVQYMDHVAGRIVTALDELGLRNNTIVLFTGDNGTGGSGKGKPAELGARVPLIVSCPGTVLSGVVSEELVDLSDVLPALAEFAGAPLPKDRPIDGRSLAPTLCGEQGTHREWIFSYIHKYRVLRDKRWLLEGDGRFFDCGDRRNGRGYVDVTDSKDPQVVAARRRFERILKDLPAPKDLEARPDSQRGKKAKKKRPKKVKAR